MKDLSVKMSSVYFINQDHGIKEQEVIILLNLFRCSQQGSKPVEGDVWPKEDALVYG